MMFKSFPLGSDLVSFSDQSIDGVGGAIRMLMEIRPHVHRLDASHNTLGTDGTVELFKSLDDKRRRYSADPASPMWGMREINLASNSIGDDGLVAAATYVSKDLSTRKLLMPMNLVTLEEDVDLVVRRLNASYLQKLSLTNNPLHPPAVQKLFEALNAPKLAELHLSTCDIPPACVPAICAFIRSPRSQHLGVLELNGNALGRLGITMILDAIDAGNFSISRIGLFANNATPKLGSDSGSDFDEDIWRERNQVWESDENMDPADPRSMATQIERRVPQLQKRNGELTRRVRKAAATVIAPTRIILHAREPNAGEVAARVLADTEESRSSTPVFPLLELPAEVRLHIARHCSGDAYALSDAQWARVRAHAAERGSVANLGRRMRSATGKAEPGVAQMYKGWEVKAEWLEEMGCEWWELEDQGLWQTLDEEERVRKEKEKKRRQLKEEQKKSEGGICVG